MSGKGSKALRIESRRERNLGSANVKKKRAWYARFSKLTADEKRKHRQAGAQQFT